MPSSKSPGPSARFQRSTIFPLGKSANSELSTGPHSYKSNQEFKAQHRESFEGEFSTLPGAFSGFSGSAFLASIFSGNFFPGKESSKFAHRPNISNFDDRRNRSREEEPAHIEDAQLQKRKRGRPKKSMGEGKSLKKKSPDRDLELKEDNLIFMNENAHVFESDSDEQKLDLLPDEIDNDYSLFFSSSTGVTKSTDSEERTRSYRLDIGKLICAIESEQAKNKIKKFVCRFCGKAFDKPSSLGGHTAKTHNGLSLKYKNRLTAAKNRKTERNRIQFLKQSINDELNVGPDTS